MSSNKQTLGTKWVYILSKPCLLAYLVVSIGYQEGYPISEFMKSQIINGVNKKMIGWWQLCGKIPMLPQALDSSIVPAEDTKNVMVQSKPDAKRDTSTSL